MLLLQVSPISKRQAKWNYSNKKLLTQPSELERAAFETIQAEFQQHMFLAHFNLKRQLLIDVDASKEQGYGAIVYHLKNGNKVKPTVIEPILFLNKCLMPIKSRY